MKAKAMQVTPMFWGACALASIAGAVGGATINTQPIQKAGIGSEMLPHPAFDFDPTDSGLPEGAPPAPTPSPPASEPISVVPAPRPAPALWEAGVSLLPP